MMSWSRGISSRRELLGFALRSGLRGGHQGQGRGICSVPSRKLEETSSSSSSSWMRSRSRCRNGGTVLLSRNLLPGYQSIILIPHRNESSSSSHVDTVSRASTSEGHETLGHNRGGTGTSVDSSLTGSVSPVGSDHTDPLSSTTEVLSTSSGGSGTTSSMDTTTILGDIPDAPLEIITVAESASPVVQVFNAAGEPTLNSVGLGGWWPPGIVQHCLEFLHADLGLPWWGAILAGTIVVRTLLFPLVLKSQRNSAKMTNNMPEFTRLQAKMSEARRSGDVLMAAKYSNDVMRFMKEKGMNPLKNLIVPVAMAPIFISFFVGLRRMANLPVESLREGGMLWFTDLTIADPYYLLPLITCTTLWITLEVGADAARMNATENAHLIKYAMRIIPVVMFPFMMNFPSGILCYWVSTNAVSLVQVSILKIPAVRERLNIEKIVKREVEPIPGSDKGFFGGVKDSWNNAKITREMQDRERYDELSFKRAGRGPIPKTYKYDPTKIQPISSSTAELMAKHK